LAVAAEYLVLRWVFRRELRVAPTVSQPPPPPEMPLFVLAVVVATLIGFAVTSLLGVAPAWAAFAGAAVLAARTLLRGHETPLGILRAANVPFLLFVLALGVLVSAVLQLGLGRMISQVLPLDTALPALLAVAAIAAVLSNVINNLPAVLVLLPLVAGAGPVAVLAVLIGVNVGPNLTYPGSLSNLLWRKAARDSLDAPALEFSVIGLASTPITLVAAVCGLWLSTSVLGLR
jgi:arsenical pump membrane protein